MGLPIFTYSNGYELTMLVSDLAGNGILISLASEDEENASIILPAEAIQELKGWLKNLVGGVNKGQFKADRAMHFDK